MKRQILLSIAEIITNSPAWSELLKNHSSVLSDTEVKACNGDATQILKLILERTTDDDVKAHLRTLLPLLNLRNANKEQYSETN